MVISYADSRVFPSYILGFQPGEAFVVCNIANLVPSFENGPCETNAALEFSVNALQVENILVTGHSCCGGIRALMNMDDEDNSSKPVEKTKRVSLAPSVIPRPSSDARIRYLYYLKYCRVVTDPDILGNGSCDLLERLDDRMCRSLFEVNLYLSLLVLSQLGGVFVVDRMLAASYPPFESLIVSLGESDDLVLLDAEPAGLVLEAVPLGINRITFVGLYCRSLDIVPTVPLFRVFYKLCKQVLLMAEFLRLPNFKGCKITVDALLPARVARVTHLANPATTLEDIPPKIVDMTVAEILCQRLLDDKEKKKKKVEEKATANSPTVKIQVKVWIDKGSGKDGPRKRRKIRAQPKVQPVSEHVSSPNLLNHTEPLDTLANEGHVSPSVFARRMGVLRAQTNEHVTPRANANETATGEEAHRYAHANLAVEGHGDNEEGLSGLKTQPTPICQHPEAAKKLKRDKVVSDKEASYSSGRFDVVPVYPTASYTLLCFEALKEKHPNLVYAYESCKDVKLRREKEHYAVEAGRGDMVRQRIINQYLPTFVRRLHHSAEYKRSLGLAFSLAIGKGFIDGISIGRKDADIQAILKATPEVDPI
nr:beta carbonic anhydrase 5, chloroplastic isoform X2 [Tanacetum cinerariifolium]